MPTAPFDVMERHFAVRGGSDQPSPGREIRLRRLKKRPWHRVASNAGLLRAESGRLSGRHPLRTRDPPSPRLSSTHVSSPVRARWKEAPEEVRLAELGLLSPSRGSDPPNAWRPARRGCSGQRRGRCRPPARCRAPVRGISAALPLRTKLNERGDKSRRFQAAVSTLGGISSTSTVVSRLVPKEGSRQRWSSQEVLGCDIPLVRLVGRILAQPT